MLKKELNQVKNISLSEFYQDSFVGTPRTIIKIRRETMKKHPIALIMQDYFFDYFTTETGKRLGYKYFTMTSLSKILDVNRTTLYRSIQVTRENNILIFIDCEEGKICLNYTNANLEFEKKVLSGELIVKLKEQQIEILENNIVNFQKSEMNTSVQIAKNEPKKMNTNVHSVDINVHLNNSTVAQMNASVAQMNTNQVSKTIVNSEVETISKNVQESLSKESLLKNPLLDHLGSSKEKNNFTVNLFDDLEKIDWVFRNELNEEKKEVKTAYEKKETIEPKKIFSENKQEQVKNDFPELQHEKKRNSEAIKDLTDAEREVQAFLTKDLEILNQDLFFSFIRKLPNDLILSKARYTLEKVSSGKVTSPEGFLRAILSKEVAKNETSGNVEVTGLVKQNDYEKAILFCSEIPSSLPQYQFVTNTISKNFATNIENNKKRIAGELYRCYCFGLLENRQEYKEKLDLMMTGLPKYLHIQDFKEILEYDSALDKAKKEKLIEMFRENM